MPPNMSECFKDKEVVAMINTRQSHGMNRTNRRAAYKKVYQAIKASQTYKARGRRSRGETGVMAWAVDGMKKIARDLGISFSCRWFVKLYRIIQRYLKGFARPCCGKQMTLFKEVNGDLSRNTRTKQVIPPPAAPLLSSPPPVLLLSL